MKKIISISIGFFCLFSILFAQKNSSNLTDKISFQQNNGCWSFTAINQNIIKVTFQPKQYSSNENISDAVLLKPLPNVHFRQSIVSINDTIIIGTDNPIRIAYYENKDGYRGFNLRLNEQEKIFGGGERALPLNRRGYQFNLYNNPWYGYGVGADNLNYSVPFFTSSNGYGLYFDNPSKGLADIGKTNTNFLNVAFVSGELTLYLIIGKKYPEILQSYHQLTGTQPLPPRWALGNLMSRFGYSSEQQSTEIVSEMKSEKIPVDAIIFDLFWFGDSIKGTLGNLDWVNHTAWPNPKKMISSFKKEGIQTILITEPFVVKNTLNYSEAQAYFSVDKQRNPYILTDFYFGSGGLIDLFRKDAQQWFWKKHIPQMNNGVEGWWGDLGEPEKHPSNLYHNLNDLGFKRLFAADEVHNLYGHTWTKMLFNNFTKDYPNKRLFSLNRSGFAGTQRFSIFPWTGDVSRSWSGLQAQLPILLGMSMSGIPYVHSDAGGFAGGEADIELYIRWLQLAAFTPIFRPHGTALYEKDPNAFSFPSEAALIKNPYKKYAKKAIDLRYQLMPYNYTLAYEQTKLGKPLMSPMYYYYQNDTTSFHIGDEYCWGEKIIAAPIIQKNTNVRNIWIPKSGAYKFGTSIYLKEGIIQDSASIENQLLYVPQGSIIPTQKVIEGANSNAYKNPVIQWQYYVPRNNEVAHKNSFTLYEDDGSNKNSIAQKKYELITLTALAQKGGYIFKINSNGGTFKGKQLNRKMDIKIFGCPKSISKFYLNTSKKAYSTTISESDASINISFEFDGKPLAINAQ